MREAALRAEIRADLLASGKQEPPARIAVIGMGRLGGAELGYGSDADVMIVAEPADGVEESEAVAWAVRIIDQMRTRLSTPSSDPPRVWTAMSFSSPRSSCSFSRRLMNLAGLRPAITGTKNSVR